MNSGYELGRDYPAGVATSIETLTPAEDHPKAAPGELNHIRRFVNTLDLEDGTDAIAEPDEMRDWLAERGLLDGEAPVNARDVDAVHVLRDAVRNLIMARIERRRPPEQAVERVNAAARLSPTAPALGWDAAADRPSRVWVAANGTALEQARARIAADAIDLIAGERGDDLIACQGPRCVRLLLKDHPRRHWCSSRCGERIRSARYYERHRKSGRA